LALVEVEEQIEIQRMTSKYIQNPNIGNLVSTKIVMATIVARFIIIASY